MAGKITDLTAIVTVAAATDLMEIVDVSDTSMAPTGTNKKITPSQLIGSVTPTITTNDRVLGLDTGAPAAAAELTASEVLDWVGATHGNILYRDSGGWAVLAPGTAGDVLTTQGAAADPTWETPAGSGILTGWVDTQFDKTNDTLQTVTGLSVTVSGSTAYVFEIELFINADVTGGLEVALDGTATFTADCMWTGEATNLADGARLLVGGYAGPNTTFGSGVSYSVAGLAGYRVVFRGLADVNAGGTFRVDFCQDTSSGTSSVLVGSNMILTPMA